MISANVLHSVKQLWRDRWFALLTVLLLGIGIAASCGTFGILYAVLLQPLPFPHAEQLVKIGRPSAANRHASSASISDIRAWRDSSQTIQDLAYWNMAPGTAGVGHEDLPAIVVRCSSGLFDTLGVQPALGRSFSEADGRVGGAIVLSSATSRRLFPTEQDVLGRTVFVAKKAYTVVGVLRDGFAFPLTEASDSLAQVWIANASLPEWEDPENTKLEVLARLRRGQTINAARADLGSIAIPNRARSGPAVVIEDYRASISGDFVAPLVAIEVAVLVLWLVACSSVVGLGLTRALKRTHETAIRTAIGATPAQLVQEHIAEITVLVGLSTVAGLWLANEYLHILQAYLHSRLPFAATIHINLPVIGFAALLALASLGLIVGLCRMSISRGPLAGALREGATAIGSGRRHENLMKGVVVFELALTVILLVVSSVLMRTLHLLRTTPLGFDPRGVVVATFPPPERFSETTIVSDVYERFLERARSIPGVESASVATILPMSPNFFYDIPVELFGREPENARAQLRIVSPEYYRSLNIRLRDGRLFNREDAVAPDWKVIVNEEFVRRYSRGQKLVGSEVRTFGSGRHKFSSIVGVVADVKQKGIFTPVAPQIDICYKTSPDEELGSFLKFYAHAALRTQNDPSLIMGDVKHILQQVAPSAVAFPLSTMDTIIDSTASYYTLVSEVMWLLTAACFLIAITGLSSLMFHYVKSRLRESAIRLSLGATPGQILASIIGKTTGIALVGIVLGELAAIPASSLLRFAVAGTDTLDFLIMIYVAIVLMFAAGIAAYFPARTAAYADPLQLMRG